MREAHVFFQRLEDDIQHGGQIQRGGHGLADVLQELHFTQTRFGLLAGCAGLFEQAGVGNRRGHLIGHGLQDQDVLIGKSGDFAALRRHRAQHLPARDQRERDFRSGVGQQRDC